MEQTFNYPDVFTTSEDTTKIVGALLTFNKEMGVVGKTSKNPFFKSNYADLPTILKATKEPLEKAGLSITHFPVGDNRLITRLSHSSGQFYQSMNYMKSVKCVCRCVNGYKSIKIENVVGEIPINQWRSRY